MKQEKVLYDRKMENIIQQVVQEFQGVALVDTRYLQFHNHTCPKCRRNMVDRNTNVVKAASISLFWPQGTRNYVIPYSLCKKCFTQENKRNKDIIFEQSQLLDHYILKQVKLTIGEG